MRYHALPQARDLPRPNHRPSIRPPFECIALLLQGAARLAPIKLAFTRRSPKPTCIPIGSPKSRSGPSN